MEHTVSPMRLESETNRRASDAWTSPFLRIGHGGAAGRAPANTIRSLTLALQAGVDMVEFDVRPCRDELVLLHDDSLVKSGGRRELTSESTLAELRSLDTAPDCFIPTLAEALDLLKGRALIHIDLKATGYEDAVLDQVSARRMAGDTLYSSLYPDSLRRIRQMDPLAMTGLSYPEDRGNASSKPYLQPAVTSIVALMRLALPYRVLSMMTNAQANAVMLYHKVISGPAVRAVQHAGGKVFAWTVDELGRMRQLYGLGINGVTTNYPELFSQLFQK
jgi:glycerophosphoryl diester phosphodiesterase